MKMQAQDEPNGVLLLDKPAGMTSHDAVAKIRRLYATRRVGHTGTLDPLATGLLIILIGRAAKASEYLAVHEKHYEATLLLGQTTDTEDVTGRVLTTCTELPDAKRVQAAAQAHLGKQLQIPPMYSALKVNGQKLVNLARRGIEIERTPREITCSSVSVKESEKADTYFLSVTCSAGTYIRTLCADIGKELGCGGVMAALRRTAVGGFSVDRSHSLAELENMTECERLSALLATETLFGDLPVLRLPAFYERLSRNGCEIYESRIGVSLPEGSRVRLCTENGMFFALGEIRSFPNGLAVKAIKLFDI